MNRDETNIDENWLRHSLRGITPEELAAQDTENWIRIAIRHYSDTSDDDPAQQIVGRERREREIQG